MKHSQFLFWQYFADKKYTELFTLKLFQIFTDAVKMFFVNAQSLLKLFSVRLKM